MQILCGWLLFCDPSSGVIVVRLQSVFLFGGGTERDEVELDALRQVHDSLDDLDRVLGGVAGGGVSIKVSLSLSFSLLISLR